MVTKPKETEAASEETPEEPLVLSPSDGATPEEQADQQEETPQLSLEDAQAELKNLLNTPEGQERLGALLDIVGEEYIEKKFGPVIESRAQSKADRANWQAQLKDDVRATEEWFQGEYQKMSTVKEGETVDAEKVVDLGAQYVSRLRDHQLKYALKAHKIESALTDDDRRRLDSVKGERDAAVAIRGTVDVYLNRAYQKGIEDAEGVVKGKVEKELGVAEKLGPLLEFLKGGATKPSVTSSTTSAGDTSDQARLDRLAAGMATDADKQWWQAGYGKKVI
jgi:uncharacterized protein YdeI (BOF family)